MKTNVSPLVRDLWTLQNDIIGAEFVRRITGRVACVLEGDGRDVGDLHVGGMLSVEEGGDVAGGSAGVCASRLLQMRRARIKKK